MDVLTIIRFAIVIFAIFYISSMILALIFELRRSSLYKQMQMQIRHIGELGFTAAVTHVKVYKITEDHRRKILKVDRVQQILLKICNFFAFKNERNKGSLLFIGK